MKILRCYLSILTLFFINPIQSEESFVKGHLMGQLGNQLFQIAVTTSLALDHGATPIFPDLKTCTEFNIPLNYAHVFSHLNAEQLSCAISAEYKETNFHFTPLPYQPNMELFGWFQSEKYFKHHKEEILTLFAPSKEILSYLQDKYQAILDHPKTVAIHIRLYKDTSPAFHPFVGWNYIYQATKAFDEDSLFIVFSDQINLCKKKLFRILRNRHVIFIEGNTHFHDLYLMSLCKHNILSNSSFSWWGAYLNKNPDKIVIAPSPTRWFGSAMTHCNTQDILPEQWKVLF